MSFHDFANHIFKVTKPAKINAGRRSHVIVERLLDEEQTRGGDVL